MTRCLTRPEYHTVYMTRCLTRPEYHTVYMTRCLTRLEYHTVDRVRVWHGKLLHAEHLHEWSVRSNNRSAAHVRMRRSDVARQWRCTDCVSGRRLGNWTTRWLAAADIHCHRHCVTDTYRQWDVHRQTATHSHRHPGTHRARHSYHCHIQLQEWTKHKSNLYSALCCHRIKLLAISMTAWKLLNLTRIYTV